MHNLNPIFLLKFLFFSFNKGIFFVKFFFEQTIYKFKTYIIKLYIVKMNSNKFLLLTELGIILSYSYVSFYVLKIFDLL